MGTATAEREEVEVRTRLPRPLVSQLDQSARAAKRTRPKHVAYLLEQALISEGGNRATR